jgi:nicotinate-nucleotide adenylyltransferase
MTRNSGVGIYGGTFNPIHVGHLRAAEEVAEMLGLERVTFVPSAQPPHKRASELDPIAPAEERLAWVRVAVAGNPRFDVDAIEVERGGASFAVETLRSIGGKTAPELPVFIIGHDAFVELGSWREPEKLLTLANFAVTTRPPVTRPSLSEWLPAIYRDAVEIAADGLSGRHRTAGSWIRLIEISRLDISSSDIRARLRAGRSVRYLIPDGAHAAITGSGAYCASANNEQST